MERDLNQETRDLSTNPFAALFPSLQHAEDYIRSTKETNHVMKEQNQIGTDTGQFNFTKKESRNDEQDMEDTGYEDKPQMINDFLQRGFLFTVNSGNICKLLKFLNI